MRFAMGLLCSLVLAGCVTHVDKNWVDRFQYDSNVKKPHWTVEELQRDQQACRESAYYLARGVFFMDMKEYETVYRQCMEEERGWEIKKEKEPGETGK